MVITREVDVIDLCVAGFTACVGILAFNTSLGMWRVRNGGTLLRGLVATLVAFTIWTFEIFGTTLYEWYDHLPVSPLVYGMANLDRLTLAVPMAVLLIWIVPSIGREHKVAPFMPPPVPQPRMPDPNSTR